MKFGIVAEHRQEMLLEAHHQRMHPAVEQDVGALDPHLGRVAGGEVLDVDGRRDHRAGNAEPLGDMALHLGAEHQFGLGGGDGSLDLEMIVADQRLDPEFGGDGSHFAGEFAVEAAEAADGEAEFVRGNAGGGGGMGRIAEDEDTLAGEVGAVDRPAPPRQAEVGVVRVRAPDRLR